jgi:hypothetical protein
MGGKAKAPEPPDYSPIASANAAAAERQFQLGEQQLAWGKEQFERVWPYASQYMTEQVGAAQDLNESARGAQAMYESTYKPIEAKFAAEAAAYNTPERANQNASRAMADVANTIEAQRKASIDQLESYGIDPSQTRFGALDLGIRINKAAAMAAAGTQSRLNTEATGLALEGEAINVGRGYPGAIASSYNAATNAGSSGINAGNSTGQTGANMMGSPTNYFSGGNTALGNWGNTLNMGYQNQLAAAKFDADQSAGFSRGIGSLIGGGLGLAASFGA